MQDKNRIRFAMEEIVKLRKYFSLPQFGYAELAELTCEIFDDYEDGEVPSEYFKISFEVLEKEERCNL